MTCRRPGDLSPSAARQLIPVYARIVGGEYVRRLPRLKTDLLGEMGLSKHPKADEVWEISMKLTKANVDDVYGQQVLHETVQLIGNLLRG